MPVTSIPQAGIAFMDIGFTIANPVYDGDKATVVMTDNVGTAFPADGGAATGTTCWVTSAMENLSSPGTYTTCSATGTTITITNLAKSGVNTNIKVRVLSTFNTVLGTASAIASVKTEDASTKTIDETSSALGSFTKGSYTNESPNNGEWGLGPIDEGTAGNANHFSAIAGAVPKAGGAAINSTTTAFKLKFKTTKAFQEANTNKTKITVRLPFETTESSIDRWFFSSTTQAIWI